MKLLLLAMLTMIFAVSAALIVMEDPGYMLIAIAGWTIETSLVLVVMVLILSFGVLHYTLRFFSGVQAAPSNLRSWRRLRREQKAENSLTHGLIDLAEGHWASAEKRVTQYAEEGHTPLLNYLAAARAAQAQGEDQRRDNYLKLAHANNPSADIAVGLTQAELQFNQNQLEQALATLTHLHQLAPRHVQVLKVLSKLYQKLEDWHHLRELLPALRKRKVFSSAALNKMAQDLYVALLQVAEKNNRLLAEWSRIPKDFRENKRVLCAYVQGLLNTGESALAEPLLRQSLQRKFDEPLMRLYGLLESSDPNQQLIQIENFLVSDESNAVTLLAAGRASLHASLWGKARRHLEASVNSQPSMEAYNELGNLLDQMGENDAALENYRAGLRLSPGCEQPMPVTLHSKELALELSST